MGKHLPKQCIVHCYLYDPCVKACKNCCHASEDVTYILLMQECEAFYKVYLDLEERLGPGGIVDKPIEDPLPAMYCIPVKVNGAFAAELALKALLYAANITYETKNGHQLEYLFHLLPATEKIELNKRFHQLIDITDEQILANLRNISNTFNEQRYLFDTIGHNHPNYVFFKHFVHTLCDYVLYIDVPISEDTSKPQLDDCPYMTSS